MTVTALDAKVLSDVIRRRLLLGSRARKALAELEASLRNARRVERVPADVVTMSSILLVREMDSHVSSCLVLVFPWEADTAGGRLSVLSPLGAAVLGRREGDVVVCRDAKRTFRFRIEEVIFQPEASLSALRARP